ncbi:transcription antitermination factor NusB [Sulfuriroseicoccus oceanibius]|uniref:SAM-dependent MTase RsmB/NOP-type domain-containing protein n=1 Tax=Sulfuriroseicoccus oceanibius TaxID=2707525 RepID=A0A6B3LAE0_9BACT|nr:transcription antitermination factor NusB [Sulfuriroseicoccus oceanibius]QQL46182.1 hypothetical protein G3M56_006265 [Sulfuriroseicoccus oceanibius]
MPSRPSHRQNARSAAHQILCDWDPDKRWAEKLIAQHAKNLRDDDQRLATRLVMGTLQHLRTLDFVLTPMLRNGIDSVAPTSLWALRLGVEQLLFTRIPAHAAVSETVSLVSKHQRGFVNAIMRRVQREKSEITAKLEEAPAPVRYSIPDKLFNRWVEAYGEDATIALCEVINEPAPTTFRINELKPDARQRIEASGIAISPVEDWEDYYQVADPKQSIPADWFEQGWIYAQDPAASVAVRTLAPQPGEQVLDACAAPGGKTFLTALAINNQGNITATDSDPDRIERIEENCQRLGITCASTATTDWTDLDATLDVPAAVLIDAPCSNTGVLRRRIDARYRKTTLNPGPITSTQRRILANILTRIPDGGRCVYSTCSIDPAENAHCVHRVIDELTSSHPELKLTFVEDHQTLPHIDDVDGHYAALIKIERQA